MRWHFLFFLLIPSTHSLVYEYNGYRRFIFYEDLETRCEHVTYDFNSIVHRIYTSLAEVQHVTLDANLKSFANEVHEHVAVKIRQSVQSFCTNGDQDENSVFVTNKNFTVEVRPIFEKFHLNNSDDEANAALGRLYSAYLYTTETLKALRSQEAIIGFNELQFMMKHPHLNILNYTYSNISCKPESLQIQAKACIVSAPNDDFYLPYFRQDEKGNLTLGTSWWQDGRKHKTTYHHKTLFENAIDKQPTFMIRTNDTLTFFSNENCFIPHAEDGHLLDRRSGFWLSAGFRIISCSRKNIVATHNYDLEKDCNLFEYDSSSDSRHPSYYFATYVNNSPTVLLNCTLDDRNITVEEIVTWQPYAIQHRLHSQSASGELAQKKMNEISVWNHNQLFEIDHTNTSLDVEFDREKQTELQSTKACSGTETSFVILLILSIVTNIAFICVCSRNKFVELWRLCFKNRSVDEIQLNDTTFTNENFEPKAPKN